ncbi:MAG: hypothetical protein EXR05_03670 [Acetobacteraceae bacterium]|nr:hypothetical protein [Acetobacteraceae bacterium]
MSFRLTSLSLLAVPVLGLLTACQAPAPRPTTGLAAGRADPGAAAFCRQRAEEMYAAQNRGARIQSDTRDTPFSGAYAGGAPSRGLSDVHAMDTMIGDCIRSSASRDAGPDLSTTPRTQPAIRRASSPADLRPASPPPSPSGAALSAPPDRAPPPPRP